MTRQQVFIYFLVGIMVFSAIGTGILLLSQGGSTSTNLQTVNQTSTQEDNVDRYLPTGPVTVLTTEDLVVGTGKAVVVTDNVTVHYTGWLASDGTVFDSSVERGEPATFPLNGVIQGWQEGIPGMQVGGKRRLVIPSDLAYGPSGTPDGSIPPNSALVFEVELISIQ
jgi:FKBP-type peptidyl-prolyl cis-trans isomerase